MFLIKIAIIVICLIGFGYVLFNFFKRQKGEKVLPKDIKKIGAIDHIRSLLFLDTPLEVFTMGYFAFIALSYAGMLIAAAIVPGLYLTALYLSGTFFLLLSYKAIMEKGIVKEVSLWVWISMALSLIVFVLVLWGLDVPLIPLLQDARQYSLTLHLLGVVFGLGATTVVDIMFIHFLRNFKIAKSESLIMHLLSQMIILGLILLVLSGIALFLTDIEGYKESDRFLAKMTVILVIIINGGALNLYLTPKMERISLIKEERGKHETLKHIAFALGAISIVSWYSAFFLAMIKVLGEFSYSTLILAYALLVIVAGAASQFAKKYYEGKGDTVISEQ